jgi:preprotein translocase SecE subunit
MNSLLSYLKDTKTELGLVVWPTRSHTIAYTALVLGLSAAIALYLAGLDAGLLYGFNYLLENIAK